MAVAEDVEQREFSRYARSIGQGWEEEEVIASIADGLVVPSHVERQRAFLKRARSSHSAK